MTRELEQFSYYAEDNLWRLWVDLNNQTYQHGTYQHFVVNDTKRRDIAVASIRDRVVHRLIYDYLVEVYDKTFIYDVWSCRPLKGLAKAINRAEKFFRTYPRGFVWRADITKFFDNVKPDKLVAIIRRKICDPNALWLIQQVLESYRTFGSPLIRGGGIPGRYSYR